jgi:uncharacterized protein (TIGR02466 family)
MEHVELLPTIVSRSFFPGHAAHRDSPTRTVGESMAGSVSPLASSSGARRQTVDTLHELPAFDPLVAFVVGQVRQRFDMFRNVGLEFFIASCWATLSAPGEALNLHDHPNNYLCGVYYIKADEDSGGIVFRDPRRSRLMFDIRVDKRDRINGPLFTFVPKEGMLPLFPSWLEHLVEPNRSREGRISVSST